MTSDELKPKTKTINLLLMDGGVGDHIYSLIAVNYILKNYPWITPIVWLPDFLKDFAINVLPEETNIKGMSEMKGQYDPNRTTKTTKWDGNTSPMKIHLVDYAFLRLCDENPGAEHKNSLSIDVTKVPKKDFELPENYVVFTTGFTADVREWPAAEINKTADFVLSQGLTPVYLGQTTTKTGVLNNIKGTFKDGIDFSKGLNLIDKTNLLEAGVVMHSAKAVLGVDNGLIHVAGCTKAPIIAGFTTVSPKIRLPIRNDTLGYNCHTVTPDESLSCKFCQGRTNFLYGHDYRNCLYKEFPKKNACTTQMTAQKFIVELTKVLTL